MPSSMINFTVQDIFGSFLGFLLFPLVIVLPGYVFAWAANLFNFRDRLFISRFTIATAASLAISPVLFFLAVRFFSMKFALAVVSALTAAFFVIIAREDHASWRNFHWIMYILLLAGACATVAILSLVDLHWDEQLYFSVVSYDMTTRVSVVNAITRTGIPPANPSFFPGQPTQLTFLYYFWYILASVVDVIGGKWVDARTAYIASSAWCGIGLMGMVALYLRLRARGSQSNTRKAIFTGIGLLTVSGIDVIPVAIMMARAGTLFGDIEHWNSQIAAWVGSVLWVPHHVAAMVACLLAMLVILEQPTKCGSRGIWAAVLAGAAFASAVGLSVWIPLVFAVFWAGWLLVLIVQRESRSQVAVMMSAGLIALLLVSPFLIGILQGEGGGGQFPLQLEIRSFYPLEPLTEKLPTAWQNVAMLAALPINYVFELGFFFLAGIVWIDLIRKKNPFSDRFRLAEILLLSTVVILGSFFRSALIGNNDFGWRSWLPGQFVLLIWSVDILQPAVDSAQLDTQGTHARIPAAQSGIRKYLITMLVLGILTSTLDLMSLRLAWPLKVGSEVGRDNFSARLAFEYLRDFLPATAITQGNPLDFLDRPAGLYGTHQMVVSDRTTYGVPLDQYQALAREIAEIFTQTDVANWDSIDQICKHYNIDVLIFHDSDPIWAGVELLSTQRRALYSNIDYRIFSCGDQAIQ